MDLLLPDVSGLEVCRQIRARSSVPIIILSVRAQPTDILNGQAVGADFYFTKPFLLQELLSSVEACLRPQRAGRRGR